ncbi:adaptor medium chain 1 [Trypanosoma rangeli]|uniref:Adaptor medium chain 1 n=1 Tax=Trypanosoma rangeli TaxID=5698 RepID=A0A422NHS3_TRYRA|nr:adaptor medium chain 1 [Trypanosoma rangeli]RNF05022.1 adaptor medium chain 1 [Trypanosoma rangeli]|eukprot:RNF05022.1 adaptor medium chain 1 [Trypanosoma rangeli]
MASLFYILDSKGAPLICRSYRGDIVQDPPAVFQRRVLDEEEFRVTPVFEEQGHTYCFIRVNDVFFMMVSKINTCPLQQIAFMHSCAQVFEGYFRHVSEETVVDNFVIVYELLDEMCDFGLPQYTEAKVLKEYITQEGLISHLLPEEKLNVKALPPAVTGVGGGTPWRMPGKYKYRRNEVFLDVVENVSLLASPEGETLSSEIVGQLKMRVRLSGMPTLKLGLNDKAMLGMTGRSGRLVEMADVKFHQCVRLDQFESDRIISFIPPDGNFDLMTYRTSRKISPLVHVECTFFSKGSTQVEMTITARTTFRRNTTASFVDILIPIPGDADKPEAKCSLGRLHYAPESSVLIWSLRNLGGGKQFSCLCKFHLPSVRSSDPKALEKAPIQVKFEIPFLTASGFQVRYLKVVEKSNYEALPWVRYITQSGDYQIRTH